MKKEKKEQILNAAESLFNRFGIKKTAVDEIAEAARVAKGTLYNNFKNKEGIINELISEKISKLDDKINSFIKNVNDPILKIRTALIERMKFFKETPFLQDSQILKNRNIIAKLKEELDTKSRSMIEKTISTSKSCQHLLEDKNRIIDTISFMIKGIEDTIKSSINMSKVESDIDYILNLMFKKEKNEPDDEALKSIEKNGEMK